MKYFELPYLMLQGAIMGFLLVLSTFRVFKIHSLKDSLLLRRGTCKKYAYVCYEFVCVCVCVLCAMCHVCVHGSVQFVHVFCFL